MGYHRAGFEVMGVDIKPQPHYPFGFHQADALEFLAAHGHEFDGIHASPPCQGYSRMRHLPWLAGRTWPLLIDATRELLEQSGKPWVLENVEDAPLLNGITLCGQTFGLPLYRHRKFESSMALLAPAHLKHREVIGPGRFLNDRARGQGFVSLVGKDPRGPQAMGIDWMTRGELAEAIPPAYTAFIGAQLMRYLDAERDGVA